MNSPKILSILAIVCLAFTAGAQEIEIVVQTYGTSIPADSPITSSLEDTLGVEVTMTTPPAEEYASQLNLRAATGNLPDLFDITSRGLLAQYVDQGLVLDLTPYLDTELSDAVNFVGSLDSGTVGGAVYALPAKPQLEQQTLWIRQDWLDNLGLEAPQTLEQLFEIARAFTEDDPDGNGVDDTYGYGGSGMGASVSPIFGAFGVPWREADIAFSIVDGALATNLYNENMPEALRYVNRMWEAGVMDPDFFTNTVEDVREKMYRGSTGIVWIEWPKLGRAAEIEQYKSINPEANWVQLAPPEGPGGRSERAVDAGFVPKLFAMSATLADAPEKLEAALKVLDYVSTTEGNRLVSYGVEGVHYEVVDGVVTALPALAEEGGYFWTFQLTGRDDEEYLAVKFPESAPFIRFAKEQPRMKIYNGLVDVPETYNAADAQRYIGEQLLAFATGEEPIENYDEFLATLENVFQVQTHVDAAEAQLGARGLLE